MSISDKIVTLQNVLLIVGKIVDMFAKALDYLVDTIQKTEV